MPSIAKDQPHSRPIKSTTSKGNRNSTPNPPQERKGSTSSTTDEWIENHVGSSSFVQSLMKKFQPENGSVVAVSRRSSNNRSAPSSVSSPPLQDKTVFFDRRPKTNHTNTSNRLSLDCSGKLGVKMTTTSLNPEQPKVVVPSKAHPPNKCSATSVTANSSLLPRSPATLKESSETDQPTGLISGGVSVMQMSYLFGNSKLHKRPDDKTKPKTSAQNTNGNVDRSSASKPKAVESGGNLTKNRSSSRSTSCLLLFEDESKDRGLFADRVASNVSNTKNNYAASNCCAPDCSNGNRADSVLPTAALRKTNESADRRKATAGETKPKGILKPAVPQSSGDSSDGTETKSSTEVPYFRSVLKRTQNSDSILFEDKAPAATATKDFRTASDAPHEYADSKVEQSKAFVSKMPGQEAQNKRNSLNASRVKQSTSDLMNQTSIKTSNKVDFQSREFLEFLCSLKSNKKDTVNDTSQLSEEEVPFYKVLLKPTENSAAVLRPRSSNVEDNNIDDNIDDDNFDEGVADKRSSEGVRQNDCRSRLHPDDISTPSLSSLSLQSVNNQETRDEMDVSSNSQDSLTSRNSDSSCNELGIPPRVSLRQLSLGNQLGSEKRRAVIRLSAPSNLFNKFITDDDGDDDDSVDGNDDGGSALHCETTNKDSTSYRFCSQVADEAPSESMKLKNELYENEVSYVDVLELIALDYKNELLSKKAIQEHEVSEMFLNVDDILTLHRDKVLPQLERCLICEESSLGKVFEDLGPKLAIYKEFLVGCYDATETINQKLKADPYFLNCVSEIEAKPRSHKLKFPGHLLSLVQKIPKYISLMMRYLKLLPKDSPEYATAERGLRSIQNSLSYAHRLMKKQKSHSSSKGKVDLACVSCGKDISSKYYRCQQCQKFYCKSCFANKVQVKSKICGECYEENRIMVSKLKTETLKLMEGWLKIRKSDDVWVERWFVLDSSGHFYSFSSSKNDFEKVEMIPLHRSHLIIMPRNTSKYSNVFVLELLHKKLKYFKAPNKEDFDGWIQNLRSILEVKQQMALSTNSPEEEYSGTNVESET